ncbi:pyridoxamine 5'-phosphate oxidase family protein [Deefgea sp. CFH1-16]|uniref:pyridoxamine 5'-phosphate oxidase family protein n=1 Tax=Deefgea sp. CFH1-16 TaxID=2675457 RepID=UPI0035B3B631
MRHMARMYHTEEENLDLFGWFSSQTLVWPDFVGNGFFNTLGNVLINPRAGLLFPDFECGNLLYIAGNCTIIQNGPELAGFKGAERLILFQVEKVIRIFQRLPWSFNLTSDSPFLSSTGDWLFTNN